MLSERMLLPIFRKCLLPFKMSQIWIYLSFLLREMKMGGTLVMTVSCSILSHISAKKELIQFSLLARLDKLLMRYEKLFFSLFLA